MQEKSIIKQNILKYLESIDVSPYKFYQETGITRGILTQNNGMSEDNTTKFLAHYPGVSEAWLLTGKGEMLKQDVLIRNIVNEDNDKYELELPNKYGVPYYDVEFTSSFLEVENSQTIQPTSYISHPFFAGCDMVVRNSGQSMAKLICHGDAVGLVRINKWQEFFPLGEVYAIVTENNFRMIKIITKGIDEDHYTLISKPTDNKKDEFPPQQIKKTSIIAIFKVQASSHLF
jgi:hypothetical protein